MNQKQVINKQEDHHEDDDEEDKKEEERNTDNNNNDKQNNNNNIYIISCLCSYICIITKSNRDFMSSPVAYDIHMNIQSIALVKLQLPTKIPFSISSPSYDMI
jgi:hypothetical protein